MPKYAQIDVTTGRCIGISYLSGEVEAENMIPLTDEDVKPNDTYANGVWTPAPPPEPVEPQPDRIAQLEAENTDLNLQVIDLWENQITQEEADQATKATLEQADTGINLQVIDLWETLLTQGVIQ